MESDHHRHIKTVLIIIIGILLLILGIVIGLLIAGGVSDRPLGSKGDDGRRESGAAASLAETESQEPENSTNQSHLQTREDGTETDSTRETDSTIETGSTAQADSAMGTGSSMAADSSAETEPAREPICIVLDPGHDDTCSRNHPELGMNEQDLNLKIAMACRDELNTYEGVEVFMTREDGSCPDNGIGSDDVTGRTAYAQSVGADLFVSIHNNATGLGYPSEANGSELYISVHSAFTEESRKLGESILEELTTRVGLANRGVLTRVKPEKGYYEDGNVKDWYYLISTSVERGFPGIIIEHAFMDNPHDNELLKNDENLKAMGIADATGIAKYYDLEKREE